LHVDEEPQLEITARGSLEDVRLALRRFGLPDVSEGQRVGFERRREHPEHQPGEILPRREGPLLEHLSNCPREAAASRGEAPENPAERPTSAHTHHEASKYAHAESTPAL
jgi:hypothetical protein